MHQYIQLQGQVQISLEKPNYPYIVTLDVSAKAFSSCIVRKPLLTDSKTSTFHLTLAAITKAKTQDQV